MLPGPERDWIHLVLWSRSVENARGTFWMTGQLAEI